VSPRPGLLGRLQPQSFRARIVLATVLALALTLLGTEVLLRSVFRAQIRESLQNRLQSQANGIARRVDRYGLTALNDIIPVLPSETYIEVRERGQTQRWNGTRRDGDVTASATLPAKSIDVRISEKPARGGSSWRVASLIALGLSAVGLVVWRVSGGIAQRLRSSAAELAGLAEHVAEGELSARAEARDDELGRLAAAMNMMAERLEDSDRRQREFIADAAHELRTPVTAIEGFAGALTDGTAVSDDDRAEAATFIRDEAARLSALILQLQEVTWHDLDAPVEWRRVDLGELGREGAARFEGAAHEAGVTITGPTESINVVSDAHHIETILGNLIRNALRATPSDGRIDITVGRDATSAWLRVADTGRGIAQEHLPYIFDRLFRVGTARDRTQGGGSGLGLTIVRRLSQRLGGRVTVQSAPGEGATFTLRLPLRRASRRPRGQEQT
jgi:signal transduction histidine kinase